MSPQAHVRAFFKAVTEVLEASSYVPEWGAYSSLQRHLHDEEGAGRQVPRDAQRERPRNHRSSSLQDG